MWFQKKQIQGNTYALILIGGYKLRACIAEFLNTKIRILWYSEKRQDTSLFSNGRCNNLPGLAENIIEILTELEKKLWVSCDEIITNYPFGEVHLSISHTNHKRKNSQTIVDESELYDIFLQAEKICLTKWARDIEKLYGLKSSELDIILTRVTQIHIDGKKTEHIIGKIGEEIKLKLLNITIPKSQYRSLKDLIHYSGKKIAKIIPVEYAIGKLFPQKEVVIVDVWAVQTCLTLKKWGTIEAVSKFPVGIHHLIDMLAKHQGKTRSEILRELGSSSYSIEKKYFTEIWGQAFGMTLAELLDWSICPKNFALIGWGGNNTFLHDEIIFFPFHNYGIVIPQERHIVWEDLSAVLHHIQGIQLKDIDTMTLEMYALLEETRRCITWESDVIGISLKKALKKLWYEA